MIYEKGKWIHRDEAIRVAAPCEARKSSGDEGDAEKAVSSSFIKKKKNNYAHFY